MQEEKQAELLIFCCLIDDFELFSRLHPFILPRLEAVVVGIREPFVRIRKAFIRIQVVL